MTTSQTLLLVCFYLLAPAGVLWLCNKVGFLNKIGPVLLLYALGILAGNLLIPADARALQQGLSSAIIPIAIPLMLFNSDFRKFSFRKSLLTLVCGVVAVLLTVFTGFLLFKNDLGPEGYKTGGMLMGVYTGGTPNLAALKIMLGVKDETYLLINSYDMLVSFLYLVFLMSIGIRLFRRFLPGSGQRGKAPRVQEPYTETAPASGNADKDIWKKQNIIQVIKAFVCALLILAVSAGLASVVPDRYFMVVVILSLTTLGIAASFIPPVQKLEKSYDAGMYLVYIFSITVASMADLGSLDFRGGIYLLLYIVFVIFTSILIQALLSKLLKIDADTMIISSVTLINSPPMVPMMAAAMKNKDVMISGLSIGIVGYAIGNYLGFFMAEFLKII